MAKVNKNRTAPEIVGPYSKWPREIRADWKMPAAVSSVAIGMAMVMQYLGTIPG